MVAEGKNLLYNVIITMYEDDSVLFFYIRKLTV